MTTTIQAERYHDFSMGHRVYGHEGKCKHLHGHNYRIHFTIEAKQMDKVGRVVDFSVIKSKLCEWLEENWDHKFLIWEQDPYSHALKNIDEAGTVVTSFNPTAENMGLHLVNIVGPIQLVGTEATLVAVKIEETRKCSVNIKS